MNNWQKTMRRSSVVKAVEQTGREQGLVPALVERVLKTFMEQNGSDGWLLSGGQIRKVQEINFLDDNGETGSYEVYTESDNG